MSLAVAIIHTQPKYRSYITIDTEDMYQPDENKKRNVVKYAEQCLINKREE